MTEAAEALDKMLDWFANEDRWLKGATAIRAYPGGPVTRACMMGGVALAIWGDITRSSCTDPESVVMRQYIADLLREAADEQFHDRMTNGRHSVPFFNDHPDTTIADVRLVIEKARAAVQEAE